MAKNDAPPRDCVGRSGAEKMVQRYGWTREELLRMSAFDLRPAGEGERFTSSAEAGAMLRVRVPL